jgi:cyclin E
VTDGACSEDEILHMELVILKQLNWALSPKTPNAWAKLLLQIEGQHGEVGRHHLFTNLIKPSFSGVIHSKIMHLVDLCMLDIESLDFTYPTIAASAIFFIQESLLPPGIISNTFYF